MTLPKSQRVAVVVTIILNLLLITTSCSGEGDATPISEMVDSGRVNGIGDFTATTEGNAFVATDISALDWFSENEFAVLASDSSNYSLALSIRLDVVGRSYPFSDLI